jgi:hypothetical protein
MKSSAWLAARLAAGLTLGLSAAAQAQTVPPAGVAPASYQDHYIDGGALSVDVSSGTSDTSSREGLARSLQVDAVASLLNSTGPGARPTVVEDGLIVRSQWDTAAYGAWSLDLSGRTGGSGLGADSQGQGGVITLRQRAMPFDGGWQADTSLGDINSPEIAMARVQTRFYLPSSPMQGLSTEWRGPGDMQIIAGGGAPGVYDGIEVPDFRTLGGSVATLGAQWAPAPRWLLGGQIVQARDVGLDNLSGLDNSGLDDSGRSSSTVGLMNAAWQSTDITMQLNLLDGAISDHRDGFGAWFDAALSTNRMTQTAGAFRIDPNLTWGNQLIANDVQGGYYRFDYQSRQWLLDADIDEVRSVSGLGTNTTFLSADARYQALRDWGVGGVANVMRSGRGDSGSLEGYLDHIDRWGTSRAQIDLAHSPSGQDSTFTLQQALSTHTGLNLNAALSLERIASAAAAGNLQDSTALRVALYGGGQLSARLGVESNVQWARAIAGRSAPGVSANLSLTWLLSANWSVLLSYYDSQIGSWTPMVVQSPLTPALAVPISGMQERGVFLTLRYQRASGMHFAPLGGAPGMGAGEIVGTVYLDANANRHWDADETGVSNLTVVLDGRFSVQTDDAGHFDFPAVTAGHHVLSVNSDNLPLPWVLTGAGRAEVQVSTRGRCEIELGAERMQ